MIIRKDLSANKIIPLSLLMNVETSERHFPNINKTNI